LVVASHTTRYIEALKSNRDITRMRIAIVGAGVGGLTLARALSLVAPASTVTTVFDRRSDVKWQMDRGLGLWDDSQSCLTELGLELDDIGKR